MFWMIVDSSFRWNDNGARLYRAMVDSRRGVQNRMGNELPILRGYFSGKFRQAYSLWYFFAILSYAFAACSSVL